ncbi:MAG: tetratricopeptide repeat protein [Verrucomicrobiota bacterium]
MIKIISRIPWVAAVAVIAVSLSTPASAFLNFFEEDLENAPDNAQLQAQEAQANKLVLEAQAFERDGRTEKALGAYKKVVDIYPLTTNAALSQYKTGTIYQKLGKFKKAFDAFQKFVENYKSSAAFNSAIQSQYEITRMGQEGTFKDSFLGIPVKLQPSELTDMYGKIIKNAPYSEFAPLSQFAIAEVLEEADKPYEATAAYQLVVKNYPRSKQAPEAQLRIGRIGEDSLQRGSQDAGNLAQTREALEDVLIQFPDSNQAAVARERLGSLSERETKKQFDVAEFYEKQGRHRRADLLWSCGFQREWRVCCESAR